MPLVYFFPLSFLLTATFSSPNTLCWVQDPFDLHVLGAPPAFVLSQDQTLKLFVLFSKTYDVSAPRDCSRKPFPARFACNLFKAFSSSGSSPLAFANAPATLTESQACVFPFACFSLKINKAYSCKTARALLPLPSGSAPLLH